MQNSRDPSSSTRPRALLLGAGHAHLYSLKRAEEFSRRGFELVAVAPESFWYSGLATGVLAGRYSPEADQVDIEQLMGRASNCRFIRDRVTAINPEKRLARLQSGEELSYDVLSLNLGSEVRPIPGQGEGVFAIKPLQNLWQLRQELESTKDERLGILIVGGGPSGCEVAANIRALLGDKKAEITVLVGGDRIIPKFSKGAGRTLAKRLAKLRITLEFGSTVFMVEGRVAITKSGLRHEFDYLVNATGLHSPAILKDIGLPATGQGEFSVDEFLRSSGDARIFGGGDCVHMQGHELEKIGVYAVRQAPVLFHNLLATLERKPLKKFHPQKHCLLILNLGQGIGLARWRGFHWMGRAPFWLKDQIDRRFLARYQTP